MAFKKKNNGVDILELKESFDSYKPLPVNAIDLKTHLSTTMFIPIRIVYRMKKTSSEHYII